MEFKKIHMIHAASASGKTTYLKRGNAITLDQTPSGDNDLVGYSNGPFLLVDGDHLVSFYSSWPSAPKWWQSEARTIAHAHMYATIMTAAVKLILKQDFKVMVILFNGGMSNRQDIEELYIAHSDGISEVGHSVVEIDEDLHKEYVQSRLDEKGIKTTIQAQEEFVFPASWRDAENNRSASRALAEQEGFKVFTSFSEALSKLAIDAKLDEPVQDLTQSPPVTMGKPTDWTLKFAARGYKEGENPGKSGSTRIVWTNKDWFLVLKLFDDNGNFPKYPRTIKFWQTDNFRDDLMKWTSAQNRFEPTPAELDSYTSILKEMWSTIPLTTFPEIWNSEEIVSEDLPIKSVDGLRTYSTEDSMEKEHLAKLNDIFVEWPFEEGIQALKLKLVEETEELLEGGDEGIERSGNDISVIGTSALSEAITVAIICAKMAHMSGVQAWEFINLMWLRHKEQFDRYN